MSNARPVPVVTLSLLVAGVLGATLTIPVAGGAEPRDYQLLDSNRIGGKGGWDYLSLDAAGTRLFISRGDHVDVYDTAARKVTGTIPDTRGVHGVALIESRNLGFTSNGKANSITVFELSSLRVLKEVPVTGENPDAILYEPVTDSLYTFNGRTKNVTVLDSRTYAAKTTIAVPGKPEFVASDAKGRIYLNIETEPGQMVVIDAKTMAVKATWPLPGCNAPTGLALDEAHRRVFSVCDDGVMAVTDADTGRQVAKVKIGEGPDAAAYDAATGLVFSSNGHDGTLSVIHQDTPNKYSVVSTLGTAKGARTMALDPKSHRIYLVTADFGAAPAPTADEPHPRPVQVPDTFTVHVAGPR